MLYVFIANLTVKAVCNELCGLRHKCYQIGIQLGVGHNKLKEFEKEADPLAVTIDYWLKGNAGEGVSLSWESVVKVLMSPQVDESGLANKLNQTYCLDDHCKRFSKKNEGQNYCVAS